MNSTAKIKQLIFDPNLSFLNKVQAAYRHQLANVPVYGELLEHLGRNTGEIRNLNELTYLPIAFFKTRDVQFQGQAADLIFKSSGTTGLNTSTHFVADREIYHESCRRGFERHYGALQNNSLYALLPSYEEQGMSSLVYMVRYLMQQSAAQAGGFYRYDHSGLIKDLQQEDGRQKILIGVSFALWELAELNPGIDLKDVIVMETGGMKGRRREIIREELHGILCNAFSVSSIHSEYGMTELLSQAYSSGSGIYECPPWMKVLVRNPYNPLEVAESGKGALNIIDLANWNSCSFIASDDLGEVFEDGKFTVSGRMDNSALRGCNLMF